MSRRRDGWTFWIVGYRLLCAADWAALVVIYENLLMQPEKVAELPGVKTVSIGAFVYVKTKPAFSWLTGIGVLGAVIVMVMVWSRVYHSTLFGIGGVLILIFFFQSFGYG